MVKPVIEAFQILRDAVANGTTAKIRFEYATQLVNVLVGLDNLLSAYIEKYGDEVIADVLEIVVEAEVVDEQETLGFDSEESRMDTQSEEEE